MATQQNGRQIINYCQNKAQLIIETLTVEKERDRETETKREKAKKMER